MSTPDHRIDFNIHEIAKQLPLPEVLFSHPPYTMVLSLSKSSITVQGSHPGSLQLMKAYFEMHAPVNINDTRKPPYLKYTLSSSYVHKSDNRTLYDSLVIDRFGESWHWLNINPTPFMAFIESVLGYEQTRHDGYMTTYVRQIAFDDAQSWHGRLTYNTET